jgi:small subunit ribosomal protein S1
MDDPNDLELFLSQVDEICEFQRGELVSGEIIAENPQGFVVDLGVKRDGLIPYSDVDRLPAEEAHIEVGEMIDVMIVEPVDSDGNLVVSVSQARESSDWLRAKRLLESDEIVETEASGFNRGGLLVPFGRLRGFVPASHLSEIPRGLDEADRAVHLETLVGRKLPFKVIEVDPQRHRLVLSERKAIRQWRAQRKAQVIKELAEGEIRSGIVTSLREFGAFVDIGGADGLIHISELAWEHVDNPGQVLKVGQKVEVKVIRVDAEANRIGLSLKRLQPNPWEGLADVIRPGQELVGTVSRLASSGTYVLTEGGIEGLVPVLDRGHIPAGTEVRVRVVSFDPGKERMNLEFIEEVQLVPQTTGAE